MSYVKWGPWRKNKKQGYEGKVSLDRRRVILKDFGQHDDYPHFGVEFDYQGNIIDFHGSSSRFGDGTRWGTEELKRLAANLADWATRR